MQLQTLKHLYTPEEYLELEEKAEYKSEYRDGDIIQMSGETTNHNQIAGNICANLKFGLRGQNYRIYICAVRLWIPHYRQYTYPDVMVIQGDPTYTGSNTTTITNPSFIAEVLSKSTQNYDQGDKFLYYRSIPEFREYVLIDQKQHHVMQYLKTAEDSWLFTELRSPEATLSINSLNFQIPLNELYEQVNFADGEE